MPLPGRREAIGTTLALDEAARRRQMRPEQPYPIGGQTIEQSPPGRDPAVGLMIHRDLPRRVLEGDDGVCQRIAADDQSVAL